MKPGLVPFYVALCFQLVGPAFSQEPDVKLRNVWNGGGYVSLVAHNSSHILALYQNGLELLKIAANATPEVLGNLDFGFETPKRVVANEHNAFVLTHSKLMVVNITDPSAPELITSLELEADDLVLSGHQIFTFGAHLHILDISTITAPKIITRYTPPRSIRRAIHVNGYWIGAARGGGLFVFKLTPGNTFELLHQQNVGLFGFEPNLVAIENQIYAQSSGIEAFTLDSTGALTPFDRFDAQFPGRDLVQVGRGLALSGDLPAFAGQDGFRGFELVLLDERGQFGKSLRFNTEAFENLVTVGQQFLLGSSQHAGLQQFRTDMSLRPEASANHRPEILDVAFNGRLAFFAQVGQIQVVDYDLEEEPKIIQTLESLNSSAQRIHRVGNDLFVASAEALRRFEWQDNQLLEISHQTLEPARFEILALGGTADRLLIATSRYYFQLSLQENGTYVQTIADAPFRPAQKILIDNHQFIANAGATIKIEQFDAHGTLVEINQQNLKGSEGILKYPLSLQNNLLIAGAEVFDARNMGDLRRIADEDYLFSDANFQDSYLTTIGETGLEVWDFLNPAKATRLFHDPTIPGQKLISGGGRILVFDASTSTVSLFSHKLPSHKQVIPFLGDRDSSHTITFYNQAAIPATIRVTATDQVSQQATAEISLAPQSSRETNLSELFERSLFETSVVIEGPRSVSTSYTLAKSGVSFTQARAQKASDLSTKLTFHPPASAQNQQIALVLLENTATTPVTLSFFDETGQTFQTNLLLKGMQPELLSIKELFPESAVINGGLLQARAPEGMVLAGSHFWDDTQGSFSVASPAKTLPPASNPVRFSRHQTYGESGRYQHLQVSNQGLILSGSPGVLLNRSRSTQNQKLINTPIQEAQLVDTVLWVLTKDRLQAKALDSGEQLAELPNPGGLRRLVHYDHYLFLYGGPHLSIVDISNPNQPIAVNNIQTDSAFGGNFAAIGTQLFLPSRQGGRIIENFHRANPTIIDPGPDFSRVRRIYRDDDRLVLVQFDRISIYQSIPGSAPMFLMTFENDKDVLGVYQNQILFKFYERGFKVEIFDLATKQTTYRTQLPSGFQADQGGFNAQTLWLYDRDGRLLQFNLSDSSQIPAQDHVFGTPWSLVDVAGNRVVSVGSAFRKTRLLELDLDASNLEPIEQDLGEGFAQDMALSGNLMFIADRIHGLLTFRKDESGLYSQRSVAGENASKLALSGTNTIIAVVENENKIVLYNVTDPSNPQPSGSFLSPGRITGIAFDGSLLLVGILDFGLQILDAANPETLVLKGELENRPFFINYQNRDLAVRDGFAYLAEAPGLAIVDYRDPSNPQLVKRLKNTSIQLELMGPYLISLTRGSHFEAFEITAPQELVFKGTSRLAGYKMVADFPNLWTTSGSVLSRTRFSELQASIPWVVNNSTFQSELQISNDGNTPAEVTINVHPQQESDAGLPVIIEPQTTALFKASELLTHRSGVAVSLETASEAILTNVATYALSSDGRTLGAGLSQALPIAELKDGLILSFSVRETLKGMVLQTPLGETSTEVTLSLVDPIGQRYSARITLEDQQPQAFLVSQLFPQANTLEPFTILVQTIDGTPISGMTFMFREGRKPVTDLGEPTSGVLLP